MIDTAPQAFLAFQRWTVETGQNAMWTHRPAYNPRPVSGVGIEAEWVAPTRTFETATLSAWVAVFLTCPPRAPVALRVARALALAGLRSVR